MTFRRSASSCAMSTMLIAMESSCMRCSVSDILRKCSDRGLPEANSTVIWWHQMICPYLKFFGFEKRFQVLKQQLVLEYSSGQNDGVGSPLFADCSDGCVQPFSDSPLKCASDLSGRTSVHPVVDYTLKQRTEVEFAIRK